MVVSAGLFGPSWLSFFAGISSGVGLLSCLLLFSFSCIFFSRASIIYVGSNVLLGGIIVVSGVEFIAVVVAMIVSSSMFMEVVYILFSFSSLHAFYQFNVFVRFFTSMTMFGWEFFYSHIILFVYITAPHYTTLIIVTYPLILYITFDIHCILCDILPFRTFTWRASPRTQ